MSCRPERWWLGLAPLALIWAGANLLQPERNEGPSSAAERVRTGPARPDADRRPAAEAPDGMRGLRRSGLEGAADSSTLTATVEAGAARVKGAVPPERRAEIEGAARAALGPGVALDALRSADGAPEAFPAAAAYALGLLGRMGEGRAEVSGARIALRGAARDGAAYRELLAAAAGAPPGVVLDISGLLPPKVAPSRLGVVRTGDRLRVVGYVASEAVRRDALAAARRAAPELTVEDGLDLASGFPEDLSPTALVAFAAGILARMDAGTVEAVGRRLSLDGASADRRGSQALASDWRGSLPPGFEAGPALVRTVPASPFVFRVRRSPEAVVLSGYLPDEATREAVLASAKELFILERVIDRARLADGAPRGFRAAALTAIEAVSQTAGGEAVLSDAALALAGEVLYPQTAEQLRRKLPRSGPPGWTVTASITVPGGDTLDKAACRRKVSDLVAREPVRSAEGGGILRRSYGVLDEVAQALRSCPEAGVDIVGMPEAKASPEAKVPAQDLVRAVRDRLVQAGVPEDRVGVAAGEGGDLVPAGSVAFRWR